MDEAKKTLSRKWLIGGVVGFSFVTVVVLALMNAVVTNTDLRKAYDSAQETASFLVDSCERFGNVSADLSEKSLKTLLGTAQVFAEFLPSDKVNIDDQLLSEFIQAENADGMIVLDAAGAPVAQADADGVDGFSLWADVIAGQAVQNAIGQSGSVYSSAIERDGAMFGFVAIPYDDGALIAYESLAKSSADPYGYSISDMLSANAFLENVVVIGVKGDEVVSSNASVADVDLFSDAVVRDAQLEWKDGGLTPVAFQGSTWYALQTTYEDNRFFVLYPEEEVFSDRFGLLTGGLSVYLAICVVILAVRGYFDKRNLRATQKQLSIINAISETCDTTFLLHLDTMQMEDIKMSPAVAKVYAEYPEPSDFMVNACREIVAPESRNDVADMMDDATMEERLEDNAFLGVDVKTLDGLWYSLQVIPQRRDERGHLLSVLVATRDVTAVKRAEELSFRDKLTGLRNRNYLESRDGELMRPGDFPVSIIMADCNYLKRTNDTLGHEWGDKLLVRVAGVLQRCVPERCLVMRIGGDEFLLVCPQTDAVEADGVVADVRAGLASASDGDLTLSVSFGACTALDGETTFDEAFKAADEAMYAEKRAVHAADGGR